MQTRRGRRNEAGTTEWMISGRLCHVCHKHSSKPLSIANIEHPFYFWRCRRRVTLVQHSVLVLMREGEQQPVEYFRPFSTSQPIEVLPE